MADEAEKRPRAKRKNEPSGHDRIVMITGVIGVVVVAVSTCITAYQAYVMRGELNNTLEQQRAWIKVEAIPDGYLSYEKGALLLLRVKATNVGSVPALGVEAGTALWPAPGPGAMDKKSPRPLKNNCPTQPSGRGGVIFPGETVELFIRSPRASASDLSALADKDNNVQIMTTICVTYRSSTNSTSHHTVSSFGVVKPGRESELNASREALFPPNIELIRMGVADEVD